MNQMPGWVKSIIIGVVYVVIGEVIVGFLHPVIVEKGINWTMIIKIAIGIAAFLIIVNIYVNFLIKSKIGNNFRSLNELANTVERLNLRDRSIHQDHFYTTDIAERDRAINNLGYRTEQEVGFVFPPSQIPPQGTVPLYRLFHG